MPSRWCPSFAGRRRRDCDKTPGCAAGTQGPQFCVCVYYCRTSYKAVCVGGGIFIFLRSEVRGIASCLNRCENTFFRRALHDVDAVWNRHGLHPASVWTSFAFGMGWVVPAVPKLTDEDCVRDKQNGSGAGTTMRFVAISDTHNRHADLQIPDGCTPAI
jgi:hypothetical protein